ncbi:MAG: aldolase, partial [Rhodospirillaceae bacterium]|nr:aldolase [Rhodospirillaceae bacterium]
IVEMGFRFIMSGPERKTPGLDKGRELAGRS